MSRSFTTLPAELRLEIANHLSFPALSALSCTNKGFYYLLWPLVYKRVVAIGTSSVHCPRLDCYCEPLSGQEAPWMGSLNQLERCLAVGMDRNMVVTCRGWTRLHVAVLEKEVEVVRLLLAHGADPNARDYQGCAPLHLLAKAVWAEPYCRELMLLLLHHGAEVDAKTSRGETPLCHAIFALCGGGYSAAGELLLEHGADLEKLTENSEIQSGLQRQWMLHWEDEMNMW
jgi:hypothetical protein